MPRLPPTPRLDWSTRDPRSASPVSLDVDDIYFSGDGLSETRAVFMDPCNLPAAWKHTDTFTIGELGFGSGLNLLAIWHLWKSSPRKPNARLHFLSYEGTPLSANDAERIQASCPELSSLSQQLIAHWPARARGVQRIHLPDNITLTLHIDDVANALPQTQAHVDAWFLDGFSPAKNPDMWSPETLAQVARLARPNTPLATYTVAGFVRRNLQDAGYTVEKKPGHGRKRERLEATRNDHHHLTPKRPTNIAIIGAGIAGANAAHAFLKRGCNVTIFEKGKDPGSGASGNPTALVMPRLDVTDTPIARGLIEAYLYAQHHYTQFSTDIATHLPVTHLPVTDRDEARFQKLFADPPLDDTFLQQENAHQTPALKFPNALALRPKALLPNLIEGATLHTNTTVKTITTTSNGIELGTSDGKAHEFDHLIICAGDQLETLNTIPLPPIERRLGQIECAHNSTSERKAIEDGGYLVEAFNDTLFGSTFEPAPPGPAQTSPQAQLSNLNVLNRLLPNHNILPSDLTSRASVRATTPDRLPFAGPTPAPETTQRETSSPDNKKAPDQNPAPHKNISLIGGLGARGFLWAPLLAELIAAQTFGEPLPLETNVASALSPDRFRQRQLKRSQHTGHP